jgi:biotin---protein ligase
VQRSRYSGEGTTPTSVRHAFHTLRKILSPFYVVLPISSSVLLKEPWPASCAALVFPGGADTPYCRLLNGEGNRRIQQYVQNGGKYIGLCAGGYYGSSRCEFMEGHRFMEVIGDRELKFYPGTCRGLAFKGFKYQSEAGARVTKLEVKLSAFKDIPSLKDEIAPAVQSYYNGGGVFVDANRYESEGKIEILANYAEDLNCDSGEGKAAIVYCKVGQGGVLLTGPHPEYVDLVLTEDAFVNIPA